MNETHSLILDAGSGHDPHPKANVLCDLFMGPTLHRGHFSHIAAKRDERPFICCDIQYLPFKGNLLDSKNKAFAFVVSSHVVEHVEDPNLAIHELKRVGCHGRITFPSGLSAHFTRIVMHRWIIDPNGGHKSLNTPLRRLVRGILRRNFRIRLIERLLRILKYKLNEEAAIRW